MGRLDSMDSLMKTGLLLGTRDVIGAGTGGIASRLRGAVAGNPFSGLLTSWLGVFRRLFQSDILILGRKRLSDLPASVVFVGGCHSDAAFVRSVLGRSRSRRLSRTLVTVVSSRGTRSGSIMAALIRQGHALLVLADGLEAGGPGVDGDDRGVLSNIAGVAREVGVPVVPLGLARTERVGPSQPEATPVRMVAGHPVSRGDGALAIAFGAPLLSAEDESTEEFAARIQSSFLALTRDAARAAATSRDHPVPREAVLQRPSGAPSTLRSSAA